MEPTREESQQPQGNHQTCPELLKKIAVRVQQIASKLTTASHDQHPIFEENRVKEIYENVCENLSRIEDNLRSGPKVFRETLSDKSQQKFEDELEKLRKGQANLNELLETLHKLGEGKQQHPKGEQPINLNIVVIVQVTEGQSKSEEKPFFEGSEEKDKQRKTGEPQFLAAMDRLQKEIIQQIEAEEDQDLNFKKLEELNGGTIKHLQQIEEGISQQLVINEDLTKQMEHLKKIFGEVGEEEKHQYLQLLDKRERNEFGEAMDLLQSELMVHLKQLAKDSREEMDFGKLKNDSGKVAQELKIIQERVGKQMKINEQRQQEVIKPPEDKLCKETQRKKQDSYLRLYVSKESLGIIKNLLVPSSPSQYDYSDYQDNQDNYSPQRIFQKKQMLKKQKMQKMLKKQKKYQVSDIEMAVEVIKIKNNKSFEQYIQELSNKKVDLDVESCDEIRNNIRKQMSRRSTGAILKYPIEFIFKCSWKSSIHLNANYLSSIKLNSLPYLKVLDLSYNKLKLKQIELQLINLVNLNLNGNNLTDPDCIARLFLPALEELKLKSNNLKEFNLPNLKLLRVLDLSKNPLEKVSNLQNTKMLEQFYLDEAELKSYPSNIIYKAYGLKLLSLKGNELMQIDFDKIRQGTPNITKLDLSINKLIKIVIKEKFPSLEELNLEINKFKQLQLQSTFPNLRFLNLKYNKLLTKITLKDFGKLKKVDLSHCSIETINLCSLGSLEQLYLKTNHFENITLKDLSSLKSLDLFNNFKLRSLDLTQLKSLSKLLLYHTQYLKHQNCHLPPSIIEIKVDYELAKSYDFSKLQQLQKVGILNKNNQKPQEQIRKKVKDNTKKQVKLTFQHSSELG